MDLFAYGFDLGSASYIFDERLNKTSIIPALGQESIELLFQCRESETTALLLSYVYNALVRHAVEISHYNQA